MNTRTIRCVLGLLLAVGAVGCFDPKLEAMETFTCTRPGDCPSGYACVEELPGQLRCHRSCKEENDCDNDYQCIVSGMEGERVCMSTLSPDGGPHVDGPPTLDQGPPAPDSEPLPPPCDFHHEVGGTPPLPVGMYDIAASPVGVFVAWISATEGLELSRSDTPGKWTSAPLVSTGTKGYLKVALAADAKEGKLHALFVHKSAPQRLLHCAIPLSGGSSCNDHQLYEFTAAGAKITDLDLDARDGVIAAAVRVVSVGQERVMFAKLATDSRGGGYVLNEHCSETTAVTPLAHPRIAAGPGVSVGSLWQGNAGNQWKLVHFDTPDGGGNCPATGNRLILADVAAPGALTMNGNDVFFAGFRNSTQPTRYVSWPADNLPSVLSTEDVAMSDVVPTSVDIAWAGVPVVVGIPDKPPPAALIPPMVYARVNGTWLPLAPPDTPGYTGVAVRGVSARVVREDGPAPLIHVVYDGEVVDSGGDKVHRLFYLRCTPPPP